MNRVLLMFVLLWSLSGCDPYQSLAPTATPSAVTAVTVAPAWDSPIPHPTATSWPSCKVATGVPAGSLNLRTGAGMQYAVIRVLREGEILTVFERAAWLKVIDEQGNQGFIRARYCK